MFALIPESSCLLGTPAHAQPAVPSRTLDLADSLYADGAYWESAREYHRALATLVESHEGASIHRRLGLAWQGLGSWKKAARHFNESIQRQTDDSLIAEVQVDLSLMWLAAGEIDRSLYYLLRVENGDPPATVARRAAYHRGLISLVRHDWPRARRAFGDAKYGSSSTEQHRFQTIVDSLINRAETFRPKSRSKARRLSTFLPGLGQLYSGHWRQSVHAAALNGLTSTFLINSIRKRNTLDIAVATLVFWRYYQGNRHHAERLAYEYNETRQDRLTTDALTAISKYEAER